MAAKKSNPAMEFLVESLKNDRNAVYADVAAAAAKKRLKVYPIMWGRAKALLGYVKVAPRGKGKAAKAKAGRRGPGRPPKAATAASLDGSLASIITAVKGSEQERSRYRAALQRIQAILAEALG